MADNLKYIQAAIKASKKSISSYESSIKTNKKLSNNINDIINKYKSVDDSISDINKYLKEASDSIDRAIFLSNKCDNVSIINSLKEYDSQSDSKLSSAIEYLNKEIDKADDNKQSLETKLSNERLKLKSLEKRERELILEALRGGK